MQTQKARKCFKQPLDEVNVLAEDVQACCFTKHREPQTGHATDAELALLLQAGPVALDRDGFMCFR